MLHTLLIWLSHTWIAARTHTGDPESSGNDLESGQGLVEYALILIMVAVAAIAVMYVLGPSISNMYQNIIDVMTD